MWNFNKKEFLIGFGRTLKRIISRVALEEGRVTKARQDGSRDFISCLACINALRKAIPPALIYSGLSHDLQSSWVQDVKASDSVYFSVSDNSWSNRTMGLA